MNTGPARGMRDFLPEDVRRRQYVIGVIADVYQSYGFEPLETPSVENIETLLGKYGEEGDKLIFKILKRGEGAETGQADLALRYDLTVPLARVVAEYRAKLPKYFKRYQVQPVWRADRPQKGRFREFYQCDVDAIGSTSMVVEAEVLGAAGDVLSRLGFTAYTIRLNHRGVLAGDARRRRRAGGAPQRRAGRRSTSWTRSAATEWRPNSRRAASPGPAPACCSSSLQPWPRHKRRLMRIRRRSIGRCCSGWKGCWPARVPRRWPTCVRSWRWWAPPQPVCICGSIRRWPAGSRTTRAPFSRSPCPISPAASVAAGGTTTSLACSWAIRCRRAAFRWGWSAFSL